MASALPATLKTLFLALDSLAPLAQADAPVAMLRASYTPELAEYPHAKAWQFEQSFAPYADALRMAGYAVSPELPQQAASVERVLYVATRFAEENLASFARAWKMLKPGGVLIAAQHNDLGAKRLDAVLKKLDPARESVSKNHCRAVVVRKPQQPAAALDALLAEWEQADAPQAVPDTPLYAAPGMFSWRKVDAGSRLLIDALPRQLSGRGADIAAGWGYLTWAALQHCPDIRHITLFEAEKKALDMAARNLAAEEARTRFSWCDATRTLDTGGQPFDWAIMNPPAHDMLWSAPEASAAMFACAAEALKPSGTLWLVANRHLPYERTLDGLFSSHRTIRETGEFKVIEAMK